MKQAEALELIRIGVSELTGKEQTVDRECTSNRAAVLLLADALDVERVPECSPGYVQSLKVQGLEKQLEDWKHDSRMKFSELVNVRAERDELRAKISGIETELVNRRKENKNLYDQWGKACAERDGLTEALANSEEQRDRLLVEVKQLGEQLAKESGSRADAESKLDVMTEASKRHRYERERLYSEMKQLREELSEMDQRLYRAKGRGMPEGFAVKQDGNRITIFERGKEREKLILSLMDREALSAWFISRAELDP